MFQKRLKVINWRPSAFSTMQRSAFGLAFRILRRLTPNIISWDLTKSQPDNWQSAFWSAYGCNGTAPTDTPPAPTTTLSLPLTTATPPIPYQPCQNWIIILFDSSINLTAAQFLAEKAFLANNILSSAWTHFERLAISNFNAAPDDGLTFGDKTLNQVHSYVLAAIQPQNALPNITA
uniref:VWFA domain-containing protein n=1 Tax=Acrobeloides nanus TaxID=290746 RepID=A0A914DE50_9BILA